MNIISKILNKSFWLVVLGIAIFEALSYLGYLSGLVNTVFFFVILLIVLVTGFVKPEWAVYFAFIELFIGSKGYLYSFELMGTEISIRLGIFLVLILLWLIDIIRKKKINIFKYSIWKYLLILIAFFVVGVIVAYFKGNSLSNIFFDLNGYLFLALIFPVTQFITNKEKVIKIVKVLMASLLAVSLKTFMILFIFSHSKADWVTSIYRWIRETGVGEVTILENGLARVFLQSHIYFLVGFIILFCLLFFLYKQISKKQIIYLGGLLIIFSSVIIISYSRSFWLSFFVTILLLLIFLWLVSKQKFLKVFVFGLIFIAIFASGLGLELATINFPVLGGGGGVSASSLLLNERTIGASDEAALQSRFELLPPLWQANLDNAVLGGGFGTEVTYQTQDLRYIDMHDGDNNYTTYSFEWGYLDLWLKLGLFGIIAYLAFLLKIFNNGIKALKLNSDLEEKVLNLAFIFSFVCLIIVHATTPYLNHPLGFGLVIIIVLIFKYLTTEKSHE